MQRHLTAVARTLGVLLAAVLPAAAAPAPSPSTPAPTPRITSVAAVRNLSPADARRAWPVTLQGVVTYYEPRWDTLFVQDATGGTFVWPGAQPRIPFQPGQTVTIHGHTVAATPFPGIRETSISVTGSAPLPEPIPIDPTTLAIGRLDAQWVELEAVVRHWSVRFDRLEVELAAGPLRLTAHSPRPASGVPPPDFAHSRFRIRGVAGSDVDAAGKVVGARLFVPSLDDYHPLVPAPANPFALHLRSLESLNPAAGDAGLRLHVSGVVTLATHVDAVIAEGASSLRLHFELSRTLDDPGGATHNHPPPPRLKPGEFIEAVGYLENTPNGPVLADAWVYQTGQSRIVSPIPARAPILANGTHALRLVELPARAVAEAIPDFLAGPRRHWVFEADDIRFEAVIPATNLNLRGFTRGSLVLLTGVCEPRPRRSPDAPAGFQLTLRDAGDAVVLSTPSGWFTRETGRVAALSTVALLALLGWALLLWREGGRQRELNRQLELRIAERTAALTAANDRLEREIEQQRRTTRIRQALYQISEAVHATDDLQSLYRRIHDLIRELTGARNLYIARFSPDTSLLSFPYYVDEQNPAPPDRPLGRGFTEYVLRTGQPLLARGDQPLLADGDPVPYLPLGSPAALWLGVPLRIRGKPFGVLALQEYHNPGAFGPEEKAVLEFVAEQVAIAIDRRRAMDEFLATQTRLRESEERFSKGFHNSPGSLSIIGLHDGRYLDVNEGFTRTYGFTREQAIGRTSLELGLWPDPAHRESLERIVRAHGAFRNHEVDLRRADGRILTVALSGDVIEIAGLPFVVISALDLTDRKRAEAELLHALHREKELSQLKTNFVSLVSHEFRTPLGVILSSAEILERYHDRLPPAQRVLQLQAIGSSVRRMAHMMNEVLLLGRFEADRVEFHPTPLHLPDFCRRLVGDVSIAHGHACPIHIHLSPDLGDVDADETLLGHALTNLLSNAVKFSPPGSPVRLTVSRADRLLRFEVADQGCGIPDTDRTHLFTAFHRGRNVGQIAGTGLGLVIVRRCIELHGGTVDFTSREGTGTTFIASVPLSP